MSELISFQPKARLLLQLGDQLIRSESVAILEIIKNSYDAFASNVIITMNKVDSDDGEIIIQDDGIGMNLDIIKNVWMQPGSDYKHKIITSIKKRIKGQRLPIGEKGIGRFGVHKLGNYIELTSKTEKDKEIFLKINWKDFEQDTSLDQIKIVLEERNNPVIFKNGDSGTYIKISKLKKKWNKTAIRDLYRAAISLNSPFSSLDAFSVIFKLDNQDVLKGLIRFKDIEEYALYFADGIIEGDKIKILNYNFKPWTTMAKIDGRIEVKKDIKMVEIVKDEISKKKKTVDIDLKKFKIGTINIKLLIFDREPRILSLGVTDKQGLKEYLDTNGGIRVFREGIRIFNYGEKDNDWLELDIKRVNRPGENISNNLVIGAVDLDRLKSPDLKEKTNREGFIEDDAYEVFQKAVNFFLEKVLTLRNIDKDKLRTLYGASSVSEPVIGKLKVLRDKIDTDLPKSALKDDLLKTVKGIESDYKIITEIYTRSSSAGLSLSIVIHEVEKIVDELIRAIEKIPTDLYLKNLVKTLNKTVNDYASVVRHSVKSKEDLILLIDRALSNIQFRLRAHNVELISTYKSRINLDTTVKCVSNLFISSIMNLLDNSIWWMNYSNRKSKKILIDISVAYEGYLSVIVADNGPGFSIPPEEAIKPFISDKPEGMGLGLHITETMMMGLKGKLIFPQEFDLDIPNEFQKGAKIALLFKI